MYKDPTDDEKIPVKFGCKEEGMVDSTKPGEEHISICDDKDLCNCFD
jgi:hypothetical protein